MQNKIIDVYCKSCWFYKVKGHMGITFFFPGGASVALPQADEDFEGDIGYLAAGAQFLMVSEIFLSSMQTKRMSFAVVEGEFTGTNEMWPDRQIF